MSLRVWEEEISAPRPFASPRMEQTGRGALRSFHKRTRLCLAFWTFLFCLVSTADAQDYLGAKRVSHSIWSLLDPADSAEAVSPFAAGVYRGQDGTAIDPPAMGEEIAQPGLSDQLFLPETDELTDEPVELSDSGDLDEAHEAYERELADQYDTARIGDSTLYIPVKNAKVSPIVISGQYGWKGVDDEYGEVYVLYGDCEITQDGGRASGPVGVVWIARRVDENGAPAVGSRVYVYLEKNADSSLQLNLNQVCTTAKTNGDAWLGEFNSLSDADLRIATPGESQLAPDKVYYRALNFLKEETGGAVVVASSPSNLVEAPAPVPSLNSIKPENAPSASAQVALSDGKSALGWTEFGEGEATTAVVPQTAERSVQTTKPLVKGDLAAQRIRLLDRYETPTQIKTAPNQADGKRTWSITNGFTLIAQGVDYKDVAVDESLELSADSAIVWTSGFDFQQLATSSVSKPADADFEIYLDGNVVFRQGNSVVYAKKMYYDLKNKVGIVENAEVVAEVPDMDGAFFRLGAAKIVQRDADTLYATDAWVSTSMMGRPKYRLQTDTLTALRSSKPLYDQMNGAPIIDSATGEQATLDKQFVIAENNFVTVGNLPVFYWPWMAMDIKDRALYLKHLKFGHDGVLGTQVLTGWDLYQLLQCKQRPAGTEWDLDLDYLSRRGFGHGMTFRYERDTLWNWNSRAVGLANFYGVHDSGKDNLGHGRRNVSFPHKYRYRGIWKHRQELNFDCSTLNSLNCSWFNDCSLRNGWTFTGQIGKSSDRNYIPEFFEDEWNSSSNPETSFELKRTDNNRSFGIEADIRTDSFYTDTNWLPKAKHFWIGQALGETPFVWSEHTELGFAQFKTTTTPYDAADRKLFRYLDWELTPDALSNEPDSPNALLYKKDSFIFSTRHEIDAPFQLGPVKTTPYALGEYGFWGAGAEKKNISRLYGRLGMRFNLPIWKVDSDVESQTWYLNGLAHKMNFIVDASYADANKDFDDLVLYDQIDDWQVQDFRRRYSVTTFSGLGIAGEDAIPVRFDERYYAIRQGLIAGNVTSPSTELVDDQRLIRLGWNNRWQTKRGPAGNRRVVDWITLNAGMNMYPKQSENFGKFLGLIDYDACWQIGDRFAVVSSGLYDVWGTGQKITRVGVQRKRPGLSSCYLGIDRLSGPIDSTYLNFGLTYRSSEKWGFGFSNSFDISEGYNIGQKLSISRIGESFVVTVGASRNESKDNWGVNLSVEPVFFFDKGKREEGMLGLGNM